MLNGQEGKGLIRASLEAFFTLEIKPYGLTQNVVRDNIVYAIYSG